MIGNYHNIDMNSYTEKRPSQSGMIIAKADDEYYVVLFPDGPCKVHNSRIMSRAPIPEHAYLITAVRSQNNGIQAQHEAIRRDVASRAY